MDEYSTTPNHLAKKTREIDVWFREDYFEIIDDPPTKNPDKFVKAKLIIPVERPKRMVKKKVTMYQPVMKFKDDDLGVWYEINCELCASEELAMKKGDVVGTHAVEVEMLEEGDV